MSITPRDIDAMKKAKINRFYKGGERIPSKFIPTGLPSLDIKIGGGIPRGKIIHIFGSSGSGKTSLAMHIAKRFESNGDRILFIDVENTFPEYIRKILDIKNIDIYEPSSGEDAVDAIVDALDQDYGLIILDSVAVCTPMSQLDQSSENNAIGILPKLMAKLVKLVTDRLSQNDATLILLNHEKEMIGGYRGQVYAPAQGTILFACSLNIRMNSKGKSEYVHDSETNKLALKPSRIKILKSKTKVIHDQDLVLFLDLKGRFSILVDILILGIEFGVIVKSGAFIKYNDINLGQGLLKAVKYLLGNSLLKDKINIHISDRSRLIDKEDDIVFNDDIKGYNELVKKYNTKYGSKYKIDICNKKCIDS